MCALVPCQPAAVNGAHNPDRFYEGKWCWGKVATHVWHHAWPIIPQSKNIEYSAYIYTRWMSVRGIKYQMQNGIQRGLLNARYLAKVLQQKDAAKFTDTLVHNLQNKI